jgi:sugar phosphate isomerase/epimerase
MNPPILRHLANLWTFMGHPTKAAEWSLDQKLAAIKLAGFDGICWAGSPELRDGCRRHGLIFVGGMVSGNAADFPRLLQEQKDCGAVHVNVQLAADDLPTPKALELALALNREGQRIGVAPAIETHRGTCTETPEKHYALCDAYEKVTGELLQVSFDFSHFAVVKHLLPEDFSKRLLVRPGLIRRAQQFHFRPFNGHHVQVPITDGHGNLTSEVKDWLPFAEAWLKCWLVGNRDTDREIFICPELGPVTGGYALSTFPNSWEEAKVLRGEIEKLWHKLTGQVSVRADRAWQQFATHVKLIP